jgi:hypothetical protein
MATKLRREVEPRWVAEYVTAHYGGYEARYRVPLGPPLTGTAEQMGTEKALRISRPWRPEVDAVIIEPERLILVEGKIFKVMDGLSKLPIYASLVPETPELADHKHKSIVMELLVVRPLSWVLTAAEKAGIKVVEWAPPWIVQIWEERDKYWAPEAVKLRNERKKVLSKLGYE